MGYCTKYKLEILTDLPKHLEIEIYIEEHSCNFDGIIHEDPRTWYEHVNNMKELSLMYPDVLFKLSGEGEEQGDVWVKYFKNGKMQLCMAWLVLNDKFDESKLE